MVAFSLNVHLIYCKLYQSYVTASTPLLSEEGCRRQRRRRVSTVHGIATSANVSQILLPTFPKAPQDVIEHGPRAQKSTSKQRNCLDIHWKQMLFTRLHAASTHTRTQQPHTHAQTSPEEVSSRSRPSAQCPQRGGRVRSWQNATQSTRRLSEGRRLRRPKFSVRGRRPGRERDKFVRLTSRQRVRLR